MALLTKRCFTFLALDPKTVASDETGFVIVDKKVVPKFFFSEKEAISKAEDWAARNPKVPVLFLQTSMVFEAKKPETSVKEFKDNGELIPKRKDD